MGWTSENVAQEFNITREEQDEFAAQSFQKAESAQKAGYFTKEIVPFTVFQKDPTTGERKLVTVSVDDGIRYGTTKEGLLKIRSAFPQWGKDVDVIRSFDILLSLQEIRQQLEGMHPKLLMVQQLP